MKRTDILVSEIYMGIFGPDVKNLSGIITPERFFNGSKLQQAWKLFFDFLIFQMEFLHQFLQHNRLTG